MNFKPPNDKYRPVLIGGFSSAWERDGDKLVVVVPATMTNEEIKVILKEQDVGDITKEDLGKTLHYLDSGHIYVGLPSDWIHKEQS